MSDFVHLTLGSVLCMWTLCTLDTLISHLGLKPCTLDIWISVMHVKTLYTWHLNFCCLVWDFAHLTSGSLLCMSRLCAGDTWICCAGWDFAQLTFGSWISVVHTETLRSWHLEVGSLSCMLRLYTVTIWKVDLLTWMLVETWCNLTLASSLLCRPSWSCVPTKHSSSAHECRQAVGGRAHQPPFTLAPSPSLLFCRYRHLQETANAECLPLSVPSCDLHDTSHQQLHFLVDGGWGWGGVVLSLIHISEPTRPP